MRRSLVLLCLIALILTACGGGSPEEQMYRAVFDQYLPHFSNPDYANLLKHRVIYIQPTFVNPPKQPVPPAIIAAVLESARRQNLTQVNTPDYDGIIIRLHSITNTQPDPIITIETLSFSGPALLNYKLTHDLFGWHVVPLSGISG